MALLDAILAAPIGVALLGRLEAAHRDNPPECPTMPGQSAIITVAYTGPGEPDYGPIRIPWEVPLNSEPAAVTEAVRAVESMSFGDFISLAVNVGYTSAGPWRSSAPFELASAYADAEARRAIAEAVVARFGPDLERPVDLTAQEYWFTPETRVLPMHFVEYDRVYCCGEFTWAAFRTVTQPPPEAVDELVGAWEMDDFGAVDHRSVTPRSDVRVWEINRPEDWVELVERYPRVAGDHSGWELPGLNQDVDGFHPNAVRTAVEGVVMPDWRAVAADYDGVHLSWAGWLTTEGYVSDLPSGGVTMLRYWFSELTHWLNDVFV